MVLLQAKLYETYSKAMMKDQSELQKVETEGPAKAGLSHVFQASFMCWSP